MYFHPFVFWRWDRIISQEQDKVLTFSSRWSCDIQFYKYAVHINRPQILLVGTTANSPLRQSQYSAPLKKLGMDIVGHKSNFRPRLDRTLSCSWEIIRSHLQNTKGWKYITESGICSSAYQQNLWAVDMNSIFIKLYVAWPTWAKGHISQKFEFSKWFL
jgi:hypothetical protein